MMRGLAAIYKRELRAYLHSASSYVVLALFFLIMGLFFVDVMDRFSEASERAGETLFGNINPPNVTQVVVRTMAQLMVSLILFMVPLLSMRLIAEEKSRGTFELLVTNPVDDWGILLGKYFALLTLGVGIIALCLIYPALAWWTGLGNESSPEWPVVISSWIGAVLLLAAYAAFGVMTSSFSENQMTAGVSCLIGLIVWNILGVFEVERFPEVGEVLNELAAGTHTESFVNGVIELKDVVYFVLAAFAFLFIASKTLDARRWRV